MPTTASAHDPTAPPDQALVARQPIFGTAMQIVAYELLYRAPGDTEARVQNPAHATAQVVIGATLDIGFTHLVGDLPAWINFPSELLTSQFQPPLYPERVVIEVLEGTSPVADLLRGLRNLRQLGYRIALDDFDIRTESSLLIEHADIVKVDIREHTPAELVTSLRKLRNYPVRLVAEKIETREELELCRALGFDFFQGYFLERPKIVQAWRAPSNRLTVIELIVRLNDSAATVEQIETIVCRDVGLGYRLLRCINSSYFRMPREVNSIREGILLLGLGELHKLCWLMLLAGVEEQTLHVCTQSLQRARMCEALCRHAGLGNSEAFFMTGMLSMLDVFLGVPMRQALQMLPLRRSVQDALLHRAGDLGAALRCVENYERGAWEQLRFRELSAGEIADSYLQATEWADQTWSHFRRSD